MWNTSTRRLDGERLLRGRLRRYLSAVTAGMLARLATPLLALLVTPYALNVLGTQRYGLFALALALSAWLSLVDPGLAPGLRVVLARRSRRLDAPELRPLLGAAAAGQSGLAVLTVFAGAGLAWLAPPLLAIPQPLWPETRALLLCIAAGVAALVAARHYAAALDACQLGAAERTVRLGQSVARLALLVAMLAAGWGLSAAGWSYFVACLGAALAFRAASRRLLPELGWSARPSWAAFVELLRPGGWLSAGALAGLLIVGLDRAVVVRLFSLEAVTVYALSGAAFLLAESLLAPGVDAARPALAQALGRGRRDEARLIYLQLVNGVAGAAPAVALGVFAANRAFVVAWTGAESHGGLWLDLWLALALAANLWSLPHRALLSADLRAKPATLWRLGEGALNLALSVALGMRFGLAGVAAGTALAAALTSCWALCRLAAPSAGIPLRTAFRPLLRAAALSVAVGPLAFVLRESVGDGGFLVAAASGSLIGGAALALWWRTALPAFARRGWASQLRAGRRAWSAA